MAGPVPPTRTLSVVPFVAIACVLKPAGNTKSCARVTPHIERSVISPAISRVLLRIVLPVLELCAGCANSVSSTSTGGNAEPTSRRIRTMKLDGVSAFVTVATTGSISEAARHLRLSKSAVSERLSELERALDANLIQRNSRQLALTEDGAAFLERAKRIVAEAT